jgi:hypothetical protein
MGKDSFLGITIDRTKIYANSKECLKALYEQIETHNQTVEKGIIKNWGNLFVNTMDIQSFKGLR